MDEGRVLTCVCMLGYWMWDAVPIWFLYASVLVVGRCADLVPVCFGVVCGVLCRFIFLGIRPAALLVMDCFEAVFCMLRYWMRNTVPIWFLYASVLIVGHCADLVSVCFGVGCGTLCRSGSCMLRCWMRGAVPIYFFGDTAGCFIGYGLF